LSKRGADPQIAAVYAHSRGLLHKDIKASTSSWMARFTLLDWGRRSAHADGTIAKQDFVAPECYWGDHDFATDFYSLGWLAVYALSGGLPYHFAAIPDLDYRSPPTV
jgi:serine/threonine protein kinase